MHAGDARVLANVRWSCDSHLGPTEVLMLRRRRAVRAGLLSIALALVMASVGLAESQPAGASTGGGCSPRYVGGPVNAGYACISASGSDVIPDAHMSWAYIPPGCHVEVWTSSVETGWMLDTTSPCGRNYYGGRRIGGPSPSHWDTTVEVIYAGTIRGFWSPRLCLSYGGNWWAC